MTKLFNKITTAAETIIIATENLMDRIHEIIFPGEEYSRIYNQIKPYIRRAGYDKGRSHSLASLTAHLFANKGEEGIILIYDNALHLVTSTKKEFDAVYTTAWNSDANKSKRLIVPCYNGYTRKVSVLERIPEPVFKQFTPT